MFEGDAWGERTHKRGTCGRLARPAVKCRVTGKQPEGVDYSDDVGQHTKNHAVHTHAHKHTHKEGCGIVWPLPY